MWRTLLVFIAGVLVGANLLYYAVSHGLVRTHAAGDVATGVTPPPVDAAPAIATRPASSTPVPATPTSSPSPASAAVPASATPAEIGPTGLLLPVAGVRASQLVDTFTQARSDHRVHDAIDIMAPAGTPVLAVADGTVEKLFDSKLGGTTLYQFNPQRTLAYYYAHLQGYAPGITEKQSLKRGQVIGYVGATGNADPAAPHLHFAIFELGPEQQWWKGTAINPYPQLRGDAR